MYSLYFNLISVRTVFTREIKLRRVSLSRSTRFSGTLSRCTLIIIIYYRGEDFPIIISPTLTKTTIRLRFTTNATAAICLPTKTLMCDYYCAEIFLFFSAFSTTHTVNGAPQTATRANVEDNRDTERSQTHA